MPSGDSTVIYSGNIVQADLLKCLLEGAGIPARLEDEFVGMIAPYAAAPGGAGAVKVIVAAGDVERARRIVEDFVENSKDRRRWSSHRLLGSKGNLTKGHGFSFSLTLQADHFILNRRQMHAYHWDSVCIRFRLCRSDFYPIRCLLVRTPPRMVITASISVL
jgi:hypothetical protein